jgi:UDP-N-acetylglucosamine 2-epimerase
MDLNDSWEKIMKITSIVGARPNFVKLAPVSRQLRKEFEEIIVHTGQHYDYEMDRIFFEELGIPDPDYHLNIGSGSHGHQTGEMLKAIEDILAKEGPDLVLVFGDTNTTLAGALAAAKLHIKVAHIEAGLRSFNKIMPEELNRVLTDHCSDLLLCPTKTAVENLSHEGITNGVHLTGDVMVDILKECAKIAEQRSKVLSDLGLNSGHFILSTVHRAENTDNIGRLSGIVKALCEVARDQDVVFPCHPRTQKQIRACKLWDELSDSVQVIKPVGYLDMLVLEKSASKILTDSGGVQKEAYLLGIPCITMRDETEWLETVDDGWNAIVGADKDEIVQKAHCFHPTKEQNGVFGDGKASEKIMQIFREMNIPKKAGTAHG